MFSKPQAEHEWLHALAGEWQVTTECSMGPDAPMMTMESRCTGRLMDGMWLLLESGGECPDMGAWSTLMCVGYDPVTKRYVGTFVGSMMTHLWIYQGQRHPETGHLVLETEGPICGQEQEGGTAKYLDTLELLDGGGFRLSSKMQKPDGQWQTVMSGVHKPA